MCDKEVLKNVTEQWSVPFRKMSHSGNGVCKHISMS